MKVRQLGSALGACVLFLSGVGCPSLAQPLGEPDGTVIDPALVGTWEAIIEHSATEGAGSPDATTPHVFIGIADGELSAVHVTFKDSGELEYLVLRGHACTIDGVAYLNLRVTDASEDMSAHTSPGWYILRYVVVGDELSVTQMNFMAVNKALHEGRLQGDPQNYYVTSPLPVVRAFMAEQGDALFEGAVGFRRWVAPTR